ILYHDSNSDTIIENSTFENVTSSTPSIFLNNNIIREATKPSLTIRNCKFKNFKTNISNFIHTNGGAVSFIDSQLENIEAINHKTELEFCDRFPYNCAIFGSLENNSGINFVNTVLKNITGYVGFSSGFNGKLFVDNCFFQNNQLKYGHIYISDNKRSYGVYNITNSVFDNNISDKGTIVHVYKNLYSTFSIDIDNTIFKNNHANDHGGVMYSSSKFNNNMIKINDCQFFNNSAGQSGYILMSLNKNSIPLFIYKNEELLNEFLFYLNDTKSFTSNPSYIACDPRKKYFSINSGITPFETINCNIYDDYGNEIKLDSNIDDYSLNDLLYFSVNIYDENGIQSKTAKIYGSHNGYCWSNTCYIGNMKGKI
ncbi:hypothetical protein PIROE2DRAFT_17137, partial [Piromyces sp. E2]